MRTSLLTTAAIIAVSLAACSKPADKTADATPPIAAPAAPAPMTAADFVAKAGSTDMFEITEAKMAMKTSKNADVKTFAAMMVADHTKSTDALKAAIAKSGQALSPPAAIPADMQAKVDDLSKAAAADFDRAYVGQQVDAHTDALGVMQGYAAGGDTVALKDFAAATAPVVQGHLDMAKKMQTAMMK